MTTEHSERRRFVRRQWRGRLIRLRPLLLGLLVLAVVGFAGWALLFSNWLSVQRVDVEGTRSLSADEVVAAADVPVGTALARVDLDAVADRVEELPEVASASAHRSWPDSITVTVTEREPVAAVQRDGAWWVLDEEGVVFRRTGDRVVSLPVVRTGGGLGEAGLAEVATVVVSLPPDLLLQTSRVQAATIDSITLHLTKGRTVVWGSAADSQTKVEVLRVLLRQPATVYDVSVPENPTTAE